MIILLTSMTYGNKIAYQMSLTVQTNLNLRCGQELHKQQSRNA